MISLYYTAAGIARLLLSVTHKSLPHQISYSHCIIDCYVNSVKTTYIAEIGLVMPNEVCPFGNHQELIETV